MGRNGIGKSSEESVHFVSLHPSCLTSKTALLHAIASDQIPSIPQSLRVLLLGQTQSTVEDNIAALKLEEVTALQHVIRADKKRERLLREEKLLSATIENTADTTSLVQAYRKVAFERVEQQTHEARQIALRRSGARGAKAKKILLQREGELAEAEKR